MLLDDPLSAVDAHVSKYLFEECINGVMKGKTRVLVTHQLQYLSSGKFDHIIVLKDGGIFEQGSYEELMQSQGEMHRLLMALGKEEDTSGSESESEPDSQKSQPAVEGGVASATAAASTDTAVVAKKRTKSAEEVKVKMPEKKKATALMTQEERQTGSVSWEIYFYYFRSWGMVLVPLTVLFFTLTAQGLQTANNWWLSVWSSNSYNQSYQFYLGVYGGIAAASVLMVLGSTILLAYAGQRAAINMHNVAFFNLMRAPTSFFDTTPIGRILNRFSRDQDVIDSMMVDTLRMTFTMIISAVFTFVMIMIITPWFIVPFIPVMYLYYRTQTFYRHCSREIKRLDAISRSPLYSHFGETLTGLSSIRAYAEQDRFIKQNEFRINDNNRAYYIQVQSQRWLALRLDFTGALIVFFAALVSSLTAKSLSPGLVGLSLSYALQVTGMLTWMIRQTVELENNMNSVERSKYYTDSLPQEAPAEIEGAVPPKGEWPSAGAITVRGLQMRYRPELDLVLDGVSLDIKGGEKIGVVGRTGAGKSSLMVAMFRLVEAAGGSISIDGIDISKVGLQDLRSRMAIIPQDPVLYSGSLRANLDPFNQYTDEEVWFALDRAYMRKAVEALDAKLDAPVTENGDNFSVGQRCQICLARALLRKAKVLILDEATASIDMETDALIQQTIRSDFKDCTILTIAHRLNTVVDYDRVLVLSFGKVKEFDTPANLLRDPRSDFCSMVAETGAQNAESLRQMAFDKESRSQ
jgi:ABC-type multidrug transport system fused ATPase/permease subunit